MNRRNYISGLRENKIKRKSSINSEGISYLIMAIVIIGVAGLFCLFDDFDSMTSITGFVPLNEFNDSETEGNLSFSEETSEEDKIYKTQIEENES